MKTVILCGGRGTRLGKHGTSIPKALINIGDRPVIVHLMEIYARFGMIDFVLCLGHLGDEIIRYFESADIPREWKIAFAETGIDTNTGGRLKMVEELLSDDDAFCVTYGDGLANIDIGELVRFHRSHGKIATVTAVHPYSNFGLIDVDEDGHITAFREKPLLKEWINGGFFIFDRRVFGFLDINSILEREPFEAIASQGQMMAYKHAGFWKCMDTFKDALEFEQLLNEGTPWHYR